MRATPLPAMVGEILDAKGFAVVTTLNPDGAPQSSIVWATYEGDEVLFSTILGRRKTNNMMRDPRVNVLVFEHGYRFVELRGTVTISEDGGPELIQRLSKWYVGEDFVESKPTNVRVVCRVSALHAVTH